MEVSSLSVLVRARRPLASRGDSPHLSTLVANPAVVQSGTSGCCQLAQGGIHLLAGVPGSRKSGLALQLALERSARGHKSLLLLTEESVDRVRDRAERMMADRPQVERAAARVNVQCERVSVDPAAMVRQVERLVLRPAAPHAGVDLVVLDSIQGNSGASGADGAACRAALELGRALQAGGIGTLLIGHVTKQNAIRGPRSLEHGVDAVMLLDRRGGRRTLTVPKNRFGPALLRPLRLAVDPRTTCLVPSPHATATVSCIRTMTLAHGLVEVQVSAALPALASRGRLIACRGIDRDEASHVLACLQHVGPFGDLLRELDLSIALRPLEEPHHSSAHRPLDASVLHLPLALAVIAACVGREVHPDVVAVGELDLAARPRDLPRRWIEEMTVMLRAGEFSGKRLFCPAIDTRLLPFAGNCWMWGVDSLEGAVRRLWPDLDLAAPEWGC